jgi:dienelactone hydrolase
MRKRKQAARTAKADQGRQGGKPALSPSVYHRAVMDGTVQSMSWQGGDFRKWRRRLRNKLSELTGFSDMAGPRVPLAPRILWTRGHDLGTIEKIEFASEPGADATAYMCVPKGARPPLPVFICLQGHSSGMHNSIAIAREDDGAPADFDGDRDFALGCLRRGIAALCLEQRSFGERRETVQKSVGPHGCWDSSMQGLMLGRTLIGQRVFDVDRAIDYLAQRGDVDMRRLGVMGNSGGGTTTLFAAALLDRVMIAMPSCYFCSFRDSIMSMYHCVCNYVPGLLKYAEMADVMGLFAPKPVVIVAGRTDPIFPISATRREFRRLRDIYAAAGAPDKCSLVVGPEGHRFYADIAWRKARNYL